MWREIYVFNIFQLIFHSSVTVRLYEFAHSHSSSPSGDSSELTRDPYLPTKDAALGAVSGSVDLQPGTASEMLDLQRCFANDEALLSEP